jgi:hypothetical protein
MNKNILPILVSVFLHVLLAGCSEHKVDSFQEWCELISGEDLKAKYAPFWVINFSVTVDEDRIRNDYTFFLNRSFLKKAKYRVSRMAWRKNNELHIVNLSSLLRINPERMIEKWRHGIELALAKKHTNSIDICLYETLSQLFESLHIHTMKVDEEGKVVQDDVTVIPTTLSGVQMPDKIE